MKIFKIDAQFAATDQEFIFIQASSEIVAREIFWAEVADDAEPETFIRGEVEEIREEDIPDGLTIFGSQS